MYSITKEKNKPKPKIKKRVKKKVIKKPKKQKKITKVDGKIKDVKQEVTIIIPPQKKTTRKPVSKLNQQTKTSQTNLNYLNQVENIRLLAQERGLSKLSNDINELRNLLYPNIYQQQLNNQIPVKKLIDDDIEEEEEKQSEKKPRKKQSRGQDLYRETRDRFRRTGLDLNTSVLRPEDTPLTVDDLSKMKKGETFIVKKGDEE